MRARIRGELAVGAQRMKKVHSVSAVVAAGGVVNGLDQTPRKLPVAALWSRLCGGGACRRSCPLRQRSPSTGQRRDGAHFTLCVDPASTAAAP